MATPKDPQCRKPKAHETMFPFWAPRPLPRQCKCGAADNAVCQMSGLENHRNYPPFRDLPDENDIDEDYLKLDPESGWVYEPSRLWILAGEIIETSFVVRPRGKIMTRFGEEVLVNFHYENLHEPENFSWNSLQPGHSMLILFPYRRTFLDMNEGIRQENPKTVMIFDASLRALTSEVASYAECAVPESAPKCFVCKTSAVNSKPLKKCAQCKTATYCGRDCQVKHWKQGHKLLCKQADKLSRLAHLDFKEDTNVSDWSFRNVKLSPHEKRAQAEESLHDFMRTRVGTEPLSMPARFAKLLESVKTRVIKQDQCLIKKVAAHYSCFNLPLEEVGLYKGLRDLSNKGSEKVDSTNVYHVIDLRLPQLRSLPYEMARNMYFNELFLSLPKWQYDLGILSIHWAVEMHDMMGDVQSSFERPTWDATYDGSTITAISRNTRFFGSDEMQLVAAVAKHAAEAFPDALIIRVLRATANPSYEDVVRELATTETPKNMYCLWIREELLQCGRLEESEQTENDRPLVDQLLDCHSIDPVDQLLGAFRGLL